MGLFVFVWFACAILAALAANKRGRSGGAWFLLGLIFGVFALLAVLVMEDLAEKQRREDAARQEMESRATARSRSAAAVAPLPPPSDSRKSFPTGRIGRPGTMTPRQAAFLESHGVAVGNDASKEEASRLIGRYLFAERLLKDEFAWERPGPSAVRPVLALVLEDEAFTEIADRAARDDPDDPVERDPMYKVLVREVVHLAERKADS